MGFDPLVLFCRPEPDGVWAREADSSFGSYTPCAIDSVVGNVSHLVLIGLCLYRIWLIKFNPKLKFHLRSNFYNYILSLLAGCCAAERLFRLIKGVSIFNLDSETGLAPFEIVHLVIEVISWSSMVLMLLVETRIYVKEFRWYIRFGILYVLIGDAVIFNLVFPLKDFYAKSTLYLWISSVFLQVLLGICLLVYVPSLDLSGDYIPLSGESIDDTKKENPLGEHVCPERYANVFARIYFSWMTPLMQQGYERPITEKDVWKLDSWDQTETLSRKFQNSWEEEAKRSKPWILRALNRSLGGRSLTVSLKKKARKNALAMVLSKTKQQECRDVEIVAQEKRITGAQKSPKRVSVASYVRPLGIDDANVDTMSSYTNAQLPPTITNPAPDIASVVASLRTMGVYLRTFALDQMVQAASSSA